MREARMTRQMNHKWPEDTKLTGQHITWAVDQQVPAELSSTNCNYGIALQQ